MDPAKEAASASEAPQTLAEELESMYDEMDAAEEEVEEVSDEEVEETAEAEEEDAGEEEAPEEGEEHPELKAAAEEVEEEYNEPPPERWPAEMKEAYMGLPAAAKKMVLEKVFKPMQRTYTQSTQELAQMRATLDPMLQAMQQHGDQISQMGGDPAEAFRRQMAWAAHFARVGPEQGIADMQSAYGLQAGGQESVPSDEYMTPVERAMKARLDQMEQHLGQQQQGISEYAQQQQQQALQARAQSIRNELQTFAGEMENGKPAHPYIEKVGHAMAGLIRGGLVEKFDEYGSPIPVRQQITQAYSLACQMDPSIKTVSPRSSQRQVEAAKRANSTVVGNTSRDAADVADRPISSDIEDLYDQLNRRAG